MRCVAWLVGCRQGGIPSSRGGAGYAHCAPPLKCRTQEGRGVSSVNRADPCRRGSYRGHATIFMATVSRRGSPRLDSMARAFSCAPNGE